MKIIFLALNGSVSLSPFPFQLTENISWLNKFLYVNIYLYVHIYLRSISLDLQLWKKCKKQNN